MRPNDLDAANPLRIEELLSKAKDSESPTAAVCLELARQYRMAGDAAQAVRWAARVVDAGDEFLPWQRAASTIESAGIPAGMGRPVKLALLGSYTTVQFKPLLKLAALRAGVALEIYESPYGQYRQEVLDPQSQALAFGPDVVLFAVHEGEVRLPEWSDNPDDEVEREAERWTGLWKALRERSKALIVHHAFVLPTEPAFGHLAAKRRGTRYRMLQQLNMRLADLAPDDVAVVDCDRIAAEFGKLRWFDPRYWYLSKQAVSLAALPALARHTGRVIAGAVGLAKKCAVLDLDNTVWGGVIGEDQISGIRLGEGTEGEAFADFQQYMLELKKRGVVLAVCSKNNDADAREAFERHPAMRLRLEDIAAFVCNWETKPENLRRIAKTLDLGLDSLVMIDDNPVERQYIREALPEVEVPSLPSDPALYRRTLANSLLFETSWHTAEDASRSEQYRARALAAEARESAGSLEEFHRSLQMRAVIAPFQDADLARITQLVNKTNQFNLTTRRYTLAEIERFMRDPNCLHFTLRLRDRYTDHGLVGLMIGLQEEQTVRIDTWLMSCRVLGRNVEAHMLRQLSTEAALRGCKTIRGTYIPTAKNILVRNLYAGFGFTEAGNDGEGSQWIYDLASRGVIEASGIEVIEEKNAFYDAAPTAGATV